MKKFLSERALSMPTLIFYFFVAIILTSCRKEEDDNILTDSRDGEVYSTVKIGNQIWMAENLRYYTSRSYLNPDNPDPIYGRLYDWATVMDVDSRYNTTVWSGSDIKHRGICPIGWHVPNDREWTELIDYLGGPAIAGTKLKSDFDWNGSNSSGFDAVPAGRYSRSDNDFRELYDWAEFSSATNDPSSGRSFSYYLDGGSEVSSNRSGKGAGCSCRCIKD
jgi:uncharacterized protein (TIGR02145 family)